MEMEDLKRLIEELDESVSKENAKVRLSQYGDEACVVATQNGYLRFGIELLKGGITPTSTGTPEMIDVDLHYLLDDGSTIYFDTFERVQKLSDENFKESWTDKLVVYTIIAFLMALLIFAIIGLVAVIKALL